MSSTNLVADLIKAKSEEDKVTKNTLFLYSAELEWKSSKQDKNIVNEFLSQFQHEGTNISRTYKLSDDDLSECGSDECEYDEEYEEYNCSHDELVWFPTQSTKYDKVYALRFYYDGSVDRELVIGSNDIVQLNQIVSEFCSKFKFDYDKEGLHISINVGVFNPYQLLYHMNTLNAMYCFSEMVLLKFNEQKHRNNEYSNFSSSMMTKSGYPSMLINKTVENYRDSYVIYDDIEKPRGKLGKKWFKNKELSFKDFVNNDIDDNPSRILNKYVEFRYCNPKTRPFLQLYFSSLPQLFNSLTEKELSELMRYFNYIDFQVSEPDKVINSTHGQAILKETRLGKLLSFWTNGLNHYDWFSLLIKDNKYSELVQDKVLMDMFAEILQKTKSEQSITERNKDDVKYLLNTLVDIVNSPNIRMDNKEFKNKVYIDFTHNGWGNPLKAFHYSVNIDDKQAIYSQLFLWLMKKLTLREEDFKALNIFTNSYDNMLVYIINITEDSRTSKIFRIALSVLIEHLIEIPKLSIIEGDLR